MTTTRPIWIVMFVALSCSVAWFYQIRPLALGNDENNMMPFSFKADSKFGEYDKQPNVWKTRVLGTKIAGFLINAASRKHTQTNSFAVPVTLTNNATHQTLNVNLRCQQKDISPTALQNIFGAYNAIGLLLVFAALIWLADNPIFVTLGTFAGLNFYLTPVGHVSSMSWDMPAMLFFTLAYLFWVRKWFIWMLFAIVFGTLAKETVAITALLFFFTPLDLKRKHVFFWSAFVGCFLVRLAVTHFTLGHCQISTAEFSHAGLGGQSNLWHQISRLITPQLHHPLFANAGLIFVALFLLPIKTLVDKGTKVILAAFLVGQLVAGDCFDLREYFEVLPLSMIYLNRTLKGLT